MKHILIMMLMMLISIGTSAQGGHKKFNPDQFQRDQEAFITQEAKLTPQEANAFFPLFRELQCKQRSLFKKMMELTRKHTENDADAAKNICDMDNIELKMVKLKMHYHTKFCNTIPATKVKLCIKAEEKFKRKVMERLAKPTRHNKNK